MKWKFGIVLIFFALLCSQSSCVEQDFDDVSVETEEIQDSSESNHGLENQEESEEEQQLDYESPTIDPEKFHFIDNFDNAELSSKTWIKSKAKKDDIAEEIAKYDGEWSFEAPNRLVWKNDFGLVLKSKAKHAAISAPLRQNFVFDNKPFIVQYEVTMQEGQDCGGSYIKLLSAGKETADLTKFNDKTPYTIMFGPDKCGNDVKLHFIFRHVNPINGSTTEKHCRKPKERLEEPFKDKLPHLYQLIVKPDNTFQILVDHRVLNEGSLLNDFIPPVNPPREIDDPEDKKPVDWDEREKIPDPDSKKPDDWDEDAPPQIPDPNAIKPEGWLDDEAEMISDINAKKPDDWDTEIDGEWEAPLVDNPICEKAVGCGLWKAPLVPNPDYKGKWRAPLIDNPNYQGKWLPRKIPNPDFYEDLHPFKMTTISAVGIELWSMSSDILFDNLLITDDIDVAKEYASKTFDLKRKHIDKESETFLNKVITYTNENPWLWGVYIVLVGTPLTYAIYSICCSSSKENEAEALAKAKKTDEPNPDDEPINLPEKEEDDENVETEVKASPSPKSKKSDLEVDVAADVAEKNSSDDDDNEKDAAVEDLGVEDEEVGERNSPTTEGTRKRKARKE